MSAHAPRDRDVSQANDVATEPIHRRTILLSGGVAAAGLLGGPLIHSALRPQAATFIARNQKYDGGLRQTIEDGLQSCGLNLAELRGRRVLLKPNLVEPTKRIPHMTTHPSVIVAAAEVFRRWGAQVSVGEGPGHVRDTDMALDESGVGAALASASLKFVDLNYESVVARRNRGRHSTLKRIYFPVSVAEADLVVSLPKLKTHHWVGVTASMKNMYGVLPGIKYGWPKNVLHHHGIPQTVVDINATLPNTISIVDGIDCMEGDGPILGSPKHMGLLLIGTSLPAVDATVARIMGLDPHRISYLKIAADRLGPIAESRIQQRGELWQEVADPFEILDEPHLRGLRPAADGSLVS